MCTQLNLVHRLKRMDAQCLVYSHSVSEPGGLRSEKRGCDHPLWEDGFFLASV